MSGSGQSFKEAGYTYPKNLIEVRGVPLVQRVLEHLASLDKFGARYLCVLPHDENAKYYTGSVVHLINPAAVIVEVNQATSGAACSALLAVEYINSDSPLLIVNGDQLIDSDLATIIGDFQSRQLDGGIVVFEDLHPRWSFVKCNEAGLVIEVAEKRPISKFATAGFYYFSRGSDFVTAATEMIKKDAQVNGLFYVCQTYNELILQQQRIGVYQIPRKAYHSLATPTDTQAYNAQSENHSI